MTNPDFDEAGAAFGATPAPGPQDGPPEGQSGTARKQGEKPEATRQPGEKFGTAGSSGTDALSSVGGEETDGEEHVPAGREGSESGRADAAHESSLADDGLDAATDPLAEAMSTISSLEDQVARRSADLYNLEQEYKNFVRRSKAEGAVRREEGVTSVLDALLPVLDDVELARQHGDLTGPFGAIAEKLESTLGSSFGLERYGKVGEAFDPLIHEALMHSTSAEVEAEVIGTLVQPGYRIGERVLRPARVGVVSPE